jgi:hypothetical protein
MTMDDQSNRPGQDPRPLSRAGRRIHTTRSRRRAVVFEDTTLTDSWPPRLNTAL